MAGRATDKQTKQDQIQAPEEFPDEAWEPPGEDGLSPTQFAARVSAKREEAAQDAGWTAPPQPDAPLAEADSTISEPTPPPVVTDEPPPEAEEEPEPEEEAEEAEEEPGETEPEEEEEAAADAEAEEFFLDTGTSRYRSKEDALDGYREKDATIARLYRELHEQRQQAAEAMQAEPVLDEEAWHGWAREAVENGAGANGAMEALRQGGEDGYDIYLAHWLEDEDDRANAHTFNNKVQRAFAEQRAVMQTEAMREQRDPTEEAQLARQQAASLHPDFEDYSETMDRLASPQEGLLPQETRQWLTDLARSGLEGKVHAWDYLYMAAAALGAPNRRKAQAAERKQRKASSDRAKVNAIVSSAEATPTRTPLTEAELTEIRYKNRLREKWDLPLLEEE
jgi:hypothetical protein